MLAAAVLGVEVQIARGGPSLDDVELRYPTDGVRTAVWIGDSTAFGTGVVDGVDGVAARVASARGERVEMLAVPGATLQDLLRDQLPKVAPSAGDRVYVSIGSNDVTHLTTTDSFAANYASLLRRLPDDVEVVVLGVPDMGSPPRLLQPLRAIAGFRGRLLDAVVRDAVTDRGEGATYVDIAGTTGPPFRRDPVRYFASDRYHPNAEGYRLWAEAVLGTVET